MLCTPVKLSWVEEGFEPPQNSRCIQSVLFGLSQMPCGTEIPPGHFYCDDHVGPVKLVLQQHVEIEQPVEVEDHTVLSRPEVVVTEDTFEQVLLDIISSREVVVDVETTGLKPWKDDRVCGIGVAISPEVGYYFPIRHEEQNLPLDLLGQFWVTLGQVPRVIGFNLKFDLAFLYQDGYDPPAEQQLSDVIVAARMCSAERFPDLSLSGQLVEHFGPQARQYDDDFKAYLKRNKWQKMFWKAPPAVLGAYCVGDVCATWQLKDELEAFIEQTEQTVVWEEEQELTKTLWHMECVGIGYDRAYGTIKIPQLKARIANLYNEIYALAGREFNLNSTKQLTEVMNEMGITSPKVSPKTGKQAWGVDVMMALNHPIAGKIVEMRGLEKILGTYFEAIMDWSNDTVHGQFKNWGTITGRLSGINPNLQNIAKTTIKLTGNEVDEDTIAAVSAFLGARKGDGTMEVTGMGGAGGVTYGGMMAIATGFEDTDESVSVRRLFVGRPGFRLYMLDYSQMEMRVFADYVQDEELHALLEDPDFDFHTHVAKTVWGIEEDHHLWDFYRTLAKAINFGLIFGIGDKKLGAQIQKSQAEAKQYKIDYFGRFRRHSLSSTRCHRLWSSGGTSLIGLRGGTG